MVRVRIPATTANIGPGFDSLGAALALYNEFEIKEKAQGLSFHGGPEEFQTADNLLVQAMKLCYDEAGIVFPGFEISVLTQDIPIARGLGSSSACIVAGLVAANELLTRPFTKKQLLQLAVKMEGHPDNVAPALLGGMVVSAVTDDEIVTEPVPIAEGLKFVALIPDFHMSTQEAREVVLQELSLKEAVYNTSRVGLLVASLINGNFEQLKEATKDQWHQSQRGKLIAGYDEVLSQAYAWDAYAVYLSGAGPTLMALVNDLDIEYADTLRQFFGNTKMNWKVKELQLDTYGAMVAIE